MNSESRKASRDSFASQRARLHFSSRAVPVIGLGVLSGFRNEKSTVSQSRRDIVREGLIGFVPAGVH